MPKLSTSIWVFELYTVESLYKVVMKFYWLYFFGGKFIPYDNKIFLAGGNSANHVNSPKSYWLI